MVAQPGYYVPNSGLSGQTHAKRNVQPTISQSSCLDADPGHYVPSTGQSSQTACAAGTYQPSTASRLPDADPGHYVATTGQTSQYLFAWDYQPSVGQTRIDADAGSIVANNSHYTDIDYTKPISAGGLHTCAVRDDGSVACWEKTVMAKDGTTTNEFAHTDGQPWCWEDGRGDLGGWPTHLRFLDDGSTCWGYNGWGVIGDGTNTDRHAHRRLALALEDGRGDLKGGYTHTSLLDDNRRLLGKFLWPATWHPHSRL